MTREEAIAYFESRRNYNPRDGDPEAERLALAALRAQQEQESKPMNEWISVEDRLPEKDGNYLVTACDEGCSAREGIWHSTVVVVAEYYKGSWTWYNVTHWQPMPEPPKGE